MSFPSNHSPICDTGMLTMGESGVFGRYQLVRVVGSGGMAQVHLARQVGPSGFVKPCVLKRISPGSLKDETIRRMFLEEARVSALLNHPHIVQTFDYGEVDGVPYMALELVDGVNLSELCRAVADSGRWFPLRIAVEICHAVLEALAYAHTLKDLDGRPLNIIHRDVSPQNILVSRQGGVKLADFGIARHEARDEMTRGPGGGKGKPGYMPPEQALGSDIDGRSDLFALGVVMTELISARRVRRGGDMASLRAFTERVRELVDLRDDVPAKLKTLIMEMTAIEPKHRPASARVTSEELRRIADKIESHETLAGFLEKILARFFPPEMSGPPGLRQEPSEIPPVDPNMEPTLIRRGADKFADDNEINDMLGAVPEPSQASQDLNFSRETWSDKEEEGEPSGMAALYRAKATAVQLSAPTRPNAPASSNAQSAQPPRRSASKGKLTLPPPSGSGGGGMTAAAKDEPDAPAPDLARAPTSSPGGRVRVPYPSSIGARMPTSRPGNAELGGEMNPAKALELAVLDQSPPETPKPSKPLLPVRDYAKLGGIGAAIAVLGFGVIYLIQHRNHNNGPVTAPTGSVIVQSSPPGAAILVDGQMTQYKTPSEITGIPIERPVRLAVLLPRHRPYPVNTTVTIPSTTGKVQANFELKPGRIYQLETDPPGAALTFDGESVGTSPTALPVLPYGMSATVTAALEGHLTATLSLHANTETSSTVRVKLEASKPVDVVSEPTHAKVFVDGEDKGFTPIYDLIVPATRKFTLKVEKRGYQKYSKAIVAEKLLLKQIQIDLKALPLLALPMPREDMIEARALDHKNSNLRADLQRTRALLAQAQRKLNVLEHTPGVFVGKLANAENAVEDAKAKIEQLEEQQSEIESQMVEFRQRVMAKIDPDANLQ